MIAASGPKPAQRVWHALRIVGHPATQHELTELAEASPRTVRRTLRKLRSAEPPYVRRTERRTESGTETRWTLIRDAGVNLPTAANTTRHESKPKEKRMSRMTDTEVNESIDQIGEAQRKLARINADVDAEIARLRANVAASVQELNGTISAETDRLLKWAVANEERWEEGSKLQFAAGVLSLKRNPPSVTIKNEASALLDLLEIGGDQFVRTKQEIDRAAILKNPEAVAGVKGITVTQGETFSIKPASSNIATSVPIRRIPQKGGRRAA
jgi:phage host-nuclease inhibitor protein Gam